MVGTPVGFEGAGQIARLAKALYGAYDSGRRWHDIVHGLLLEFKFEQSSYDACVFSYVDLATQKLIVLCLYMDDLLGFGDSELVGRLQTFLKRKGQVEFDANSTDFSGMQISYGHDTIKLHAAKYIELMGERFSEYLATHKRCPSTPTLQALLARIKDEDHVNPDLPYQALTGCLTWTVALGRPDIAYATREASRHNTAFGVGHFAQAMYILAFLIGTKDEGITICAADDAVMHDVVYPNQTKLTPENTDALHANLFRPTNAYLQTSLLPSGAIPASRTSLAPVDLLWIA